MFEKRAVRFAGLIVLLLLPLASPALANAWRGTEQRIDGVLHVKNPGEGMLPPLTIQVEEIWRRGGDSDLDEDFFGVITDVVVDDANNFYVLDGQLAEIKIYDESGAYLSSIGREGEGPGEFRRPIDMELLPDGSMGVIQPWPSKMVLLGVDGTPIGDFPFKPEGKGFATMNGVKRVGDELAMVYGMGSPSEGSFERSIVLGLVDMGGKELAQLHSARSSMDYASSLLIERDWNHFERAWSASADGRIFARLSFTEYQIGVWSDDGQLDRVIEREYAAHPRQQRDIERIESNWSRGIGRWVRNPTFEIEPNWSPVENLYGREDGTLWVRTSRGARELPDGSMTQFDVFDSQGRFVRQISIPGSMDPESDDIFLAGGYLLVVTDLASARDAWRGGGDEDVTLDAEPMEIICYRMDLSPVATR